MGEEESGSHDKRGEAMHGLCEESTRAAGRWASTMATTAQKRDVLSSARKRMRIGRRERRGPCGGSTKVAAGIVPEDIGRRVRA